MPSYVVIIHFFELLSICIGLYYWRLLLPAYRLFWVQVLLAFSTEVIARAMHHNTGFNNIILYNFYVVLEVWLLGSACRLLLKKTYLKRLIAYLLPFITVSWFVGTIIKGITVFNNWIVIVVALFYIVFYFALLLDNLIFRIQELYKQPLFLIAIAMILYYATIIPLFGMINYLTNSDMKLASKLYNINLAAVILRYALVAIAFYLYGRQAKRAHVA